MDFLSLSISVVIIIVSIIIIDNAAWRCADG